MPFTTTKTHFKVLIMIWFTNSIKAWASPQTPMKKTEMLF